MEHRLPSWLRKVTSTFTCAVRASIRWMCKGSVTPRCILSMLWQNIQGVRTIHLSGVTVLSTNTWCRKHPQTMAGCYVTVDIHCHLFWWHQSTMPQVLLITHITNDTAKLVTASSGHLAYGKCVSDISFSPQLLVVCRLSVPVHNICFDNHVSSPNEDMETEDDDELPPVPPDDMTMTVEPE